MNTNHDALREALEPFAAIDLTQSGVPANFAELVLRARIALSHPMPEAAAQGLTFDAFRAANVARCIKWHPQGIASWSPSDWMTAVVGELGELGSLLKMRNRERDALPGNKFSPTQKQIADELADVLTYLDLLAEVLGVNLGSAAVEKFNEVSERVGFPDRILLSASPAAPEGAKPEREIEQLIRERDQRDEIIDRLCDAVLGSERPEWSSAYGFDDAVADVEERITQLHQPSVDKAWKRFEQAKAAAMLSADAQPHLPAALAADLVAINAQLSPPPLPNNITKEQMLLARARADKAYPLGSDSLAPQPVGPSSLERLRVQHWLEVYSQQLLQVLYEDGKKRLEQYYGQNS